MNKYPQITSRQAKILAVIVKENCDTGMPVASKDLVEKDYFDLSGATIRNEMQALEKLGYIMQPHTSAGRVPTDMGFRYFVSELMERVKLTMKEQEHLRSEIHKLQAVHVEMGRRLAKLLAESSEQASFALFPGETSTMGLANILDNPGLPPEDAKEVARFFDNIDNYAEQMMEDYSGEPAKAVIGKEIKLSEKSDYSMVVSGISLPDGKKGVVGLLGPKSMRYQKNMGLLEYITKLLGGGASVFVFVKVLNIAASYA
jgi:transcriptional regulator of heat shock response